MIVMNRLQMNNRTNALTLIEVVSVIAVLCVLTALLLPSLARPKRGLPGAQCVNNLKQIGLAFRCWALDNNDKFPMQVSVTNGGTRELVESGDVYPHFLVMSNELNTPKILYCAMESDRSRIVASTFDRAVAAGADHQLPFTNNINVTYFVGVDADQARPQMLLSGDDNFTVSGKKLPSGLLKVWSKSPVEWTSNRHIYGGNVGMADGSVQRFSTSKLREALGGNGEATNRLAFP